MIIHIVPMTIIATVMTMIFLVIMGMTHDEAKYSHKSFSWISWWALFLWMASADVGLWYLVSIGQ